jgi:uncharacterized membrane protein
MNKNRLEALSDGVFAVAITLLVLDIRLPAGVAYADLGRALVSLAPKILSYLLSFIVVGIYWSFHHAAFARLRRIDGTVLFLNLMLLLLVTFMPFPTILMGEYPFTTIPLVIYGGCLIAANLIGYLSVLHLHWRPELMHPEVAEDFLARQTPIYLVVNLVCLAAIALAFYSPAASYGVFFAVLIGVGFNICREISSAGRRAATNDGATPRRGPAVPR